MPWRIPVWSVSPSASAKVSTPGATRVPNTLSRRMYSMSMNSGSVKPVSVTNWRISKSETVRPSVR